MAEPVYVVENPGAGAWVLLLIPALVPPGYVVIKTWDALSVQHTHPVFKFLICGGMVAAILYALTLMYRYLPVALTTGLTVAYMAFTYWKAAAWFTADPVWIGAVVAVAALVGFFGGRALAHQERGRAA